MFFELLAKDHAALIQELPEYLQRDPIALQLIHNIHLHGHFSHWVQGLNDLLNWPDMEEIYEHLSLVSNQPVVSIINKKIDIQKNPTYREFLAALEKALKVISPWRKGPFQCLDIKIDSEWKCDKKWDRIQKYTPGVQDKSILDIGSGNGYYAFRMLGAGAKSIISCDPSQLYWCQFKSLKMFFPQIPIYQVPFTDEQFATTHIKPFDQIFSMGVLYHRKSPLDHLFLMKKLLKPGGQLVLETLFVDGPKGYALTPTGTYAKMPNVWFIPSLLTLDSWLSKTGFSQIACVHTSTTNFLEQSSTEWMTNESLTHFLDQNHRDITNEGYPAPRRAIFVATKK